MVAKKVGMGLLFVDERRVITWTVFSMLRRRRGRAPSCPISGRYVRIGEYVLKSAAGMFSVAMASALDFTVALPLGKAITPDRGRVGGRLELIAAYKCVSDVGDKRGNEEQDHHENRGDDADRTALVLDQRAMKYSTATVTSLLDAAAGPCRRHVQPPSKTCRRSIAGHDHGRSADAANRLRLAAAQRRCHNTRGHPECFAHLIELARQYECCRQPSV